MKQATHKILTNKIRLKSVYLEIENQIVTGIVKMRRFRKLIKVMVLCLWSWKRIEAAVGTERQWGYSTLPHPHTQSIHPPPTHTTLRYHSPPLTYFLSSPLFFLVCKGMYRSEILITPLNECVRKNNGRWYCGICWQQYMK